MVPIATHTPVLVRTAMTIAAHFDGAGHEVLLVVDRPLVTSENMADVHLFAAAKGITRLLARGERIDLFLTQPFVVAEAYTDLPGAYLTIEETISSFRDLLDGRYDAVPAQSFNFVGGIDQG
jgi:F-type H+/Na+-transporting ATPase subunit beta